MSAPVVFTSLRPTSTPPGRISSGFREVDRVLGGGFVPGSTLLLAGDPGAGKSTLLLQIAAHLAPTPVINRAPAYLTAEESASQIQERAVRLGLAESGVRLAETSDLTSVLAALDPPRVIPLAPGLSPFLVVVDSVQTFGVSTLTTEPGSLKQAKAVAHAAAEFAHAANAVVILVCQVTKSHAAAGPNALQHLVDVVLHLSPRGTVRVLTASKNRFGPTDQVGLLVMGAAGLTE